MKIHKQYACEYCESEFDEEKDCLDHERHCIYDPCKKKCASCSQSRSVTHYEVDYYQCKRLLHENHGCDNWCSK